MSISDIRLRIAAPTEETPPGRGFYQLEEDCLHVHVGWLSRRRRFFSFLESEYVRMDFDREGRLIFIEVTKPRRQWSVDRAAVPPYPVLPADVRWLDFRASISEPRLLTPADHGALLLCFHPTDVVRSYRIAECVCVQADAGQRLVSLWIDNLVDDLAGRGIAGFRKQHASAVAER